MARALPALLVLVSFCCCSCRGLYAFQLYQDGACTQLFYSPRWGRDNTLSAPLVVPLTNQCNFCGNTGTGVTYTKADATGVRWCSHPNPPFSTEDLCSVPQGACVSAAVGECTTACGPFGVVNAKLIEVPDDGINFVVLGGSAANVANPDKCDEPRQVAWYARYYYSDPATCNATLDCLGPREYVRDNGQVWYCESFTSTTCNMVTGMCENLHDCHISALNLNRCGNVFKSGSGIGVPTGVTDGTGPNSGSYYVTRLASNDGNSFPLPAGAATTAPGGSSPSAARGPVSPVLALLAVLLLVAVL